MKGNFFLKLALCLGALLLICSVASAAGLFDVTQVELMSPHSLGMAGVAFGVITPEVMNDAILKHGVGLRVLTVRVTKPVYDIDNLTTEQKVAFAKLKVNLNVLCNSAIPYETRLAELSKADGKVPDVTGLVVIPAEEYKFLVKRPDKSIIQMLQAAEGDPDKFFDIAQKNLVVGGDVDKLEDGIVYVGFVHEVQAMIAPAECFLSQA